MTSGTFQEVRWLALDHILHDAVRYGVSKETGGGCLARLDDRYLLGLTEAP